MSTPVVVEEEEWRDWLSIVGLPVVEATRGLFRTEHVNLQDQSLKRCQKFVWPVCTMWGFMKCYSSYNCWPERTWLGRLVMLLRVLCRLGWSWRRWWARCDQWYGADPRLSGRLRKDHWKQNKRVMYLGHWTYLSIAKFTEKCIKNMPERWKMDV